MLKYTHRTPPGVERWPSQFVWEQYRKYPIGTKCPSDHCIEVSADMTVLSTVLKACAEYIHIAQDAFMASIRELEDALR